MPPFAPSSVLQKFLFHLWREFDSWFVENRLKALHRSLFAMFSALCERFGYGSFPSRSTNCGSCLKHFPDAFNDKGQRDDEYPIEFCYSEPIGTHTPVVSFRVYPQQRERQGSDEGEAAPLPYDTALFKRRVQSLNRHPRIAN